MLHLKVPSSDGFIPWLAISPYNCHLLQIFIELRAWKWTSLGTFINTAWEDLSADPAATDRNRIVKRRFDWTVILRTIVLVSCQDAVIRLAYYQLFDNAVRVLRLRYYYPHNECAPYTIYINNSEVLTGPLALEVAAWTCCKLRENVKTLEDVEKGAAALQMGPTLVDRGPPVFVDRLLSYIHFPVFRSYIEDGPRIFDEVLRSGSSRRSGSWLAMTSRVGHFRNSLGCDVWASMHVPEELCVRQ